jgi:protein-disulfide isomerase
MSRMRIGPIALLGVSIVVASCAKKAAPSTSAPATAKPDVVATVGSTSISLEEVDQRALAQPASDFGGAKLSQALYEARRDALETIIRNQLLDREAKARGIERQALIDREIVANVATPTENDIRAWYEANSARLQGAPLDKVRAPIANMLMQERAQALQDRFVATLKAKTPVKIMLEPQREKIAAVARPTRGGANAPVEIIEFSDFQCPYCGQSYPVVKRVLSEYGDRVRLVYRQFPLPIHPNAREAAEAAACAGEQGQFWPYHDRLFENQSKLADPDLRKHAATLGLDAGKFNACLDARKYQKDIDEDIVAGQAAGVGGTPGFFINGRPLDGAQPFEAFKSVIDEELESAAAKK